MKTESWIWHFIRAAVHLSPLVPYFAGRPYLAVALLLFVLLCYIKVFKLQQQLVDLAVNGGDPNKEASIRSALNRWHALTWLKTR